MSPYRFALIGGGWRAEFYLRLASMLPERLKLTGVVVRNPQRACSLAERWQQRVYPNPEALCNGTPPEFWVVSVSRSANLDVIRSLIAFDLPIFAETPPAETVDQLTQLWHEAQRRQARIQVAEQFHRQPNHAARLAAIRLGKIGPVRSVSVSAGHAYHGASLLRRYLGLGCENARIVGMNWTDRLRDPGNRDGEPEQPQIRDAIRHIALLDFGDRQAVFDYSWPQYFSPIRTRHVSVRGEQGEILGDALHAYNAAGLPVTLPFQRHTAGLDGNLEGYYLKGIQLGERWLYQNPTAPARLSDEEIAMAEMLWEMGEYARGGPAVYSLEEALQDQYLALCLQEACDTGQPIHTTTQAWAGN